VSANPFFDNSRDKLCALAARNEVSWIYAWVQVAMTGG